MNNSYTPRRRRLRRRYKWMIGLLAAVVGIVLFGLGLKMVENRFKQREGLGDTGEWGWNQSGEKVTLSIGEETVSYTDALDAYLLIGTDDTGMNPELQQGFNGDMADFLMLLFVNRTSGKFGFLQLDRDTMADVPVLDENGEELGTSNEQICIAHWYGQNEEQRNQNTVTTVSRLLGGLPIKGYYSLSMDDVDKINHAVGGVTVKIEDDLTEIDPALKPGAEVKLTDSQAKSFVRARMTVGDGTNISRMRRQREYLQNLYTLVYGRLSEDPNYINDIYGDLKDIVDSDLPHKELSQITAEIREFEGLGFKTIEGESKLGKSYYDMKLHAQFFPDTGSILEVLGEFADLSPAEEETAK